VRRRFEDKIVEDRPDNRTFCPFFYTSHPGVFLLLFPGESVYLESVLERLEGILRSIQKSWTTQVGEL
jgi:hypothetical protein